MHPDWYSDDPKIDNINISYEDIEKLSKLITTKRIRPGDYVYAEFSDNKLTKATITRTENLLES